MSICGLKKVSCCALFQISSKARSFHVSASVVSLFLLTLPARVETLLRTSLRHHSDSESDSEVKDHGVKFVYLLPHPTLQNKVLKTNF